MAVSPPRPLCRDGLIDMLSLYLGPGSDGELEEVPCLPECLLAQGVAGVGKSVTLRWFLHGIGISHAFVHCVEAYQPRLLYHSILEQLGGSAGEWGEVQGGGKSALSVHQVARDYWVQCVHHSWRPV